MRDLNYESKDEIRTLGSTTDCCKFYCNTKFLAESIRRKGRKGPNVALDSNIARLKITDYTCPTMTTQLETWLNLLRVTFLRQDIKA